MLEDLPPKQRQAIFIESDSKIVKEIRELLRSNSLDEINTDDSSQSIERMVQESFNSFRQSNRDKDSFDENGNNET